MKKLLFLSLLVAGIVTVASAQLEIGVVGGPSFVSFSGNDVEMWGELYQKPNMKVKFHLGAFFNYRLNDQFSLEPRILFALKGPQYKGETEEYDEETFMLVTGEKKVTKMLTYIDLPLLLNFHASEQLSLFAGPQIGLRMGAKAKSEFSGAAQGGGSVSYSRTSDQKEYYYGTELGVYLGLGYKLNDDLSVNLIYNPGISKIAHVEYEGEDEKYDVKNTSILLSLRHSLKK